MTAPLPAGSPAPDFELPGSDGPVTLRGLTDAGPAVLAFFKQTCPTCRMAFPVYGRLAERFGAEVAIVAIAQDPLDEAVEWATEHEFGGLVLDDAESGYETSDAYGVRSVPTLFLVGQDGNIVSSSEGWDREAANFLAAQLGELVGGDGSPVSTEADGLPPFKPG